MANPASKQSIYHEVGWLRGTEVDDPDSAFHGARRSTLG
jgi:hypothetical protein